MAEQGRDDSEFRNLVWSAADEIMAEGHYPTRDDVARKNSKSFTVVSPVFAEWKKAHPKSEGMNGHNRHLQKRKN